MTSNKETIYEIAARNETRKYLKILEGIYIDALTRPGQPAFSTIAAGEFIAAHDENRGLGMAKDLVREILRLKRERELAARFTWAKQDAFAADEAEKLVESLRWAHPDTVQGRFYEGAAEVLVQCGDLSRALEKALAERRAKG